MLHSLVALDCMTMASIDLRWLMVSAGLKSDAWLTAPVSTLSAEEVASTHDEYTRNVFKMCKMYRDDKVIVKVGKRRGAGFDTSVGGMQSACL